MSSVQRHELPCAPTLSGTVLCPRLLIAVRHLLCPRHCTARNARGKPLRGAGHCVKLVWSCGSASLAHAAASAFQVANLLILVVPYCSLLTLLRICCPNPSPQSCHLPPTLPLHAQVSSLSVEEHPSSEIIVTLFEVEATPASISAFIEREHEFRWVQHFVGVVTAGGSSPT